MFISESRNEHLLSHKELRAQISLVQNANLCYHETIWANCDTVFPYTVCLPHTG